MATFGSRTFKDNRKGSPTHRENPHNRGSPHYKMRGDKRVMESLGGFYNYRANVLFSPDDRVMNSNNYVSF